MGASFVTGNNTPNIMLVDKFFEAEFIIICFIWNGIPIVVISTPSSSNLNVTVHYFPCNIYGTRYIIKVFTEGCHYSRSIPPMLSLL